MTAHQPIRTDDPNLACAADGTVFRNPARSMPKRDVGKALSKFRELIKDKEGTIIGAIGVSGSSVANDMAVAQAGAAAVLAGK